MSTPPFSTGGPLIHPRVPQVHKSPSARKGGNRTRNEKKTMPWVPDTSDACPERPAQNPQVSPGPKTFWFKRKKLIPSMYFVYLTIHLPTNINKNAGNYTVRNPMDCMGIDLFPNKLRVWFRWKKSAFQEVIPGTRNQPFKSVISHFWCLEIGSIRGPGGLDSLGFSVLLMVQKCQGQPLGM